MVVLLGIAGWLMQIGWFFYAMLAAVILFCLKQAQALRGPIRPAEASHMFRQHVWVGSAILAGLLGGFLL
jgi:4-hydroxybenzoate polyprenyltransferase